MSARLSRSHILHKVIARRARALDPGTRLDLFECVSHDAVEAGGPALIDVPMTNDPVPAPGHWNINDIYEGRFD